MIWLVITIVSKELQKNETEADVETATPKKDMCPEERQQINDQLRLV